MLERNIVNRPHDIWPCRKKFTRLPERDSGCLIFRMVAAFMRPGSLLWVTVNVPLYMNSTRVVRSIKSISSKYITGFLEAFWFKMMHGCSCISDTLLDEVRICSSRVEKAHKTIRWAPKDPCRQARVTSKKSLFSQSRLNVSIKWLSCLLKPKLICLSKFVPRIQKFCFCIFGKQRGTWHEIRIEQ